MGAILLTRRNGATDDQALSGGISVPGGMRFYWRNRYAWLYRDAVTPNRDPEGPYLRIYPRIGEPSPDAGQTLSPLPSPFRDRGMLTSQADYFSLAQKALDGESYSGYQGVSPQTIGSITLDGLNSNIYYEIDALNGGSVWVPYQSTLKWYAPGPGTWAWDFYMVPDAYRGYAQEKRCQTRVVGVRTAVGEARSLDVPVGASSFRIQTNAPATVTYQLDGDGPDGYTASFGLSGQNQIILANAYRLSVTRPSAVPATFIAFEIQIP